MPEPGARFIVSPNFDEEIVKETLALDMVSMPGCMSPTEIVAADKAVADFIENCFRQEHWVSNIARISMHRCIM